MKAKLGESTYVLMNQQGFYVAYVLHKRTYTKDQREAWRFETYLGAHTERLPGERVIERDMRA